MEPLEIPEGATHVDIPLGFYYKAHPMTGKWLVWSPELGKWMVSAFGFNTPAELKEILYPQPEPQSTDSNDEVNQPSHYKRKSDPLLREVRSALLEDGDVDDLECIEAMLSHLSTIDQIRGALRANSFKYRWRYEDKDRLKSLRKARWYEDKLDILEEIVDGV